MKRIVYIGIVIVIALTVVFVAACGETNSTNQGQDNKSICETLAALAQKNYSKLVLSVEMTEKSKTLSGEYTVTKQDDFLSVEYSYQQYTTFQEVDGELVAPENEIETLSGKLTTQNGTVVDQSGVALNVSIETVTAQGFVFNESYFKDVTSSNTRFCATVANSRAFIGIDNVSDMTVAVDFSQTEISRIVVQYSIGTRTFVLSYTFD